MNRLLIDSIIRDANATRRRIRGVSDGKSVDEARFALANEILAFGQSLLQLEAVNPDIAKLSLEVVDEANKGPVMLAGYAMKLAREVGNGNLKSVIHYPSLRSRLLVREPVTFFRLWHVCFLAWSRHRR